MTIFDHYDKEKKRLLENCLQCGLCAEGCPILPYTDISGVSSQDIQGKSAEMAENGQIRIDLLKDKETLALKGYKGIYDELNG